MIDLSCPSCGRVGSVPKEKERTRLVCRKCHSVFHRTDDGRTHLGEPRRSPAVADARQAPKTAQPVSDAGFSLLSVGDFSRPQLQVLAGVLLLGIVVLGFAMFSEPSPTLENQALMAAVALVDSDLRTLQKLATPKSEEDVIRWRESILPQIEEMKVASLTSRLAVDVVVTRRNEANGSGQVSVFIMPAGVQARSQTVADGQAKPNVREFVSFWTLDTSGRWRLDGQSTLQSLVASR